MAGGCRYVIVNVFLGFILFMWVAQPFLYWYNVYDARNFMFFGAELFNPDGTPYDVSLVSRLKRLWLNLSTCTPVDVSLASPQRGAAVGNLVGIAFWVRCLSAQAALGCSWVPSKPLGWAPLSAIRIQSCGQSGYLKGRRAAPCGCVMACAGCGPCNPFP